jgi:hypothetical protein
MTIHDSLGSSFASGEVKGMRKLLYVLFAMLLLGHLEAASACRAFAGSKQQPGGPQEQLYEMASTVFIGHVIRTEEGEPSGASPTLVATLRIKEVLKGEPPADGKVRASAQQYCNVLLVPGFDYVIFLYGDNLVLAPNRGAYPLFDHFAPEPGGYQRVLDKLRALSKKAQ